MYKYKVNFLILKGEENSTSQPNKQNMYYQVKTIISKLPGQLYQTFWKYRQDFLDQLYIDYHCSRM